MSDKRKAYEDLVLAACDQLRMSVDATVLAATLTVWTAHLWQALIAARYESPDSVTQIYQLALQTALEPRTEPVKVMTPHGPGSSTLQ